MEENTNRSINLCGKTCPETFVEAKLALENLEGGGHLEVIVDDSRSAERIPRNMKNHGQTLVSKTKVNGTWKLILEHNPNHDRDKWVLMD